MDESTPLHFNHKHGHAHTGNLSPTYKTWNAMRARCQNPKSLAYSKYGARGIKVCDRWNTFAEFLADMGARPGPEYSIDRIDNSGHYEPGNCRWATVPQQVSNKRNNRTFVYRGVTYTVAEAVRVFGIPRGTLINRHRRGWTGEQIVNEPKKPGVSIECRSK